MNAALGVLLVDDDVTLARSLARELSFRGWDVRVAGGGEAALQAIHDKPCGAILIDLHMPDMDGLSLMAQLQAEGNSAKLLLWSGNVDVEVAVRAVRSGAIDVLQKPISGAELDAYLRTGHRLRAVSTLTPTIRHNPSDGILGEAPSIRVVREQVRTVSRFRDLPVLITGETGTGKELVAQAVHASSETDGPFIPVNCAAIPEQLFESELFGHDAGSFTGARGARVGMFEAAAAGTLFLDEIGELPSGLQPKLLRAVETRSFRRVGGTRDIPFRARLISATHRSLIGTASVLRNDLYYRLAGFTIATPPLRDRTSDIDMLACYFLSEFAKRYQVSVEFSPRALEALHAYEWPGNVRELRAVVQQAAVLSTEGRVGVAELALALRDRQERPNETLSMNPVERDLSASQVSGIIPVVKVSESLRDIERRTILQTWDSTGHNLSAAARALGLPRTTLRDRLRKYGLR
jgi:DNA-binding NtrC family response regulator